MDKLRRKCVGAVLVAFGLGMLIAKLIPIWGLIAAVVIAAVGVFLLSDGSC